MQVKHHANILFIHMKPLLFMETPLPIKFVFREPLDVRWPSCDKKCADYPNYPLKIDP